MSNRLRENLRELARNIEANSPKVDAKAPSAERSARPNDAIKVSVGKYHDALQRLAQE